MHSRCSHLGGEKVCATKQQPKHGSCGSPAKGVQLTVWVKGDSPPGELENQLRNCRINSHSPVRIHHVGSVPGAKEFTNQTFVLCKVTA